MGILNTNSLAALNSQIDTTNVSNLNTLSVVITGTWVGTLSFQGSMDGTNFFNITALNITSGLFVNTTTTNNQFLINCVGYNTIRIKMTSYTSGSATCEIFNGTTNTIMTTLATLVGASDGTKLGNVGDRLKVDANFSIPPNTKPSFIGSKTRLLDMNALNGGVARDTIINSTSVYTDLFNYSGSGDLFSFLIQFEGNLLGADAFVIKLEIDSTIVFEIVTSDVGTGSLYDLSRDGDENTMGISLNSNVFKFSVPRGFGLSYSTNLKVAIKKATSTANKKFRAGLIFMTKDT